MSELGAKNGWQGAVPIMNMAGIAIFEDQFIYIPTGDYELALVDSVAWVAKDGTPGVPGSVRFNWKIASGPQKGKPLATYAAVDAEKEGNKRSWKAHYLTVGANEQALDQPIQPLPDHFKPGILGYAHVESPPEGEKGKYADVTLIRKATYLARVAAAPTQQPGQFQVAPQQPGLPTAPSTPMFQQAAPAPIGAPMGQNGAAPMMTQPVAPQTPAAQFGGLFTPRQ